MPEESNIQSSHDTVNVSLSPAPILNPAQHAKKKNRIGAVIICGVITTFFALISVYLILIATEVNVMGWYINLIFPAGAILVGLLASSGYALAAWGLGVKINKITLAAIIAIQICSYFAIHYTEYAIHGPIVDRSTGHIITFTEYYHLTTVNMQWKSRSSTEATTLGGLGYLVRSGEIIGFVIGTLVAPALLMTRLYCELCERYMKKRTLFLLPGIDERRDQKDPDALLNQNLDQAKGWITLAQQSNLSACIEKIAALEPLKKQIRIQPRHIVVNLHHCPQCTFGFIEVAILVHKGNSFSTTPLSHTEIQPAFIRQLLDELL